MGGKRFVPIVLIGALLVLILTFSYFLSRTDEEESLLNKTAPTDTSDKWPKTTVVDYGHEEIFKEPFTSADNTLRSITAYEPTEYIDDKDVTIQVSDWDKQSQLLLTIPNLRSQLLLDGKYRGAHYGYINEGDKELVVIAVAEQLGPTRDVDRDYGYFYVKNQIYIYDLKSKKLSEIYSDLDESGPPETTIGDDHWRSARINVILGNDGSKLIVDKHTGGSPGPCHFIVSRGNSSLDVKFIDLADYYNGFQPYTITDAQEAKSVKQRDNCWPA